MPTEVGTGGEKVIVVGGSMGKPAACRYDLETRQLDFAEYLEETSATSFVSVAVDYAGNCAYVGTGIG